MGGRPRRSPLMTRTSLSRRPRPLRRWGCLSLKLAAYLGDNQTRVEISAERLRQILAARGVSQRTDLEGVGTAGSRGGPLLSRSGLRRVRAADDPPRRRGGVGRSASGSPRSPSCGGSCDSAAASTRVRPASDGSAELDNAGPAAPSMRNRVDDSSCQPDRSVRLREFGLGPRGLPALAQRQRPARRAHAPEPEPRKVGPTTPSSTPQKRQRTSHRAQSTSSPSTWPPVPSSSHRRRRPLRERVVCTPAVRLR